ncbi:EAL domain-containing protein [Aureimonas sp. ME7]|uniref:putative bifunctional diguanylate cyclase/phosphodiesterase n=1 Tax=Aureimonas sp. ME7 TaxID=2744252 RepID=UPI0015F3FC70|nr:EAL domain-containing protein [Aureimonas sp. ME7]
MRLITCIGQQHDLFLLVLAAGFCLVGSSVTIRLVRTMMMSDGRRRIGWGFLAAVTAGCVTWCTHFIGILAYDPGAAVSIDPTLTMVSLLVAVGGALPGLLLAGCGSVLKAAIGGSVVGASIAAMHYLGMLAYRVEGILHWQWGTVILSVTASLGLAGLSLALLAKGRTRPAVALLFLAILSLHLLGMSALAIEPLSLQGSGLDDTVMRALAMAVAGVGLMVAGAGAVTYLLDEEARNRSVEHLRVLALSDALTGLPNRVALSDHLSALLESAREANARFAVVGIDLDRFKEINDLRGHAAGDKALRQVAQNLTAILKPGEYVARVGGDEFAAVTAQADEAAVLDFVSRLETALHQPLELDGLSIPSGGSLGIALFPENGDSVERLLANADLAMYRAKADLEHRVRFYENRMDEAARERRELGAELRLALSRGELALHYQVQQSVQSGAVSGYEVLLRWFHPKRGTIPPAVFIPLAEQSGHILEIGEWVLREACREASRWHHPHKIAVNISPVQFVRADLAAAVAAILRETGLPPERLELEVTESTLLIDRARTLGTMRAIKALGVSLALDDFGIGYSSFETLRNFPFDKIKLDRSFMTEFGQSVEAKAIVRAILTLGRTLRISVLAEGVETDTQLGILREEGCDEAQGYLLGRPGALVDTPLALTA